MPDTRTLLDFHRFCLMDQATQLYQQAIFATVKPGHTVVDIGAGSGILAFFACQAGARHVYAIEADASIELAKILARANGLDDRITFLPRLSYQVDLPEQVDVVISNTLECFGVEGGLVGAMIDARQRFLRANGQWIPRNLTMYLVPIDYQQKYAEIIDQWNEHLFDCDFSPLRSFAVNNLYPIQIQRDKFLSEPQLLASLELSSVAESAVCSDVSFIANQAGTLHGLCGWFACELMPGLSLSNEPEIGNTRYNQAFLPLRQAIKLNPGDQIHVAVSVRMPNVWRWRVSVTYNQRTSLPAGQASLMLDQSTFWGFPLSREELRHKSAIAVPQLSQYGEAELLLLRSVNGQATIADLEQLVKVHFSSLFHSDAELGTFVRKVVSRCS